MMMLESNAQSKLWLHRNERMGRPMPASKTRQGMEFAGMSFWWLLLLGWLIELLGWLIEELKYKRDRL